MYIAELEHRYGITRKPLYDRLKALNIKLAKDGNRAYANEEQIKLLDQQNKHIKNGGTLKNFVPITHAEVTVDTASIVETTQHNSQLTTQSETTQLITNLSQAIAEKMQPVDPLWYLGRLEAARASGWELTTSQIKSLIGVKPTCPKGKKTYKRGSFVFVKVGKIGRQTAWKVQKVNDVDSTHNYV